MVTRSAYPEKGPVDPARSATADVLQPTRRHFLARLAAAGVAAAGASSGALALVSYRDDAAASSKDPSHAWCMVIDLRSCDGCKLCTIACQKRHELPAEQTWIKVNTVESSAGGTFPMPVPCMMCENPPCMYVCPVSANFRTDEGLVLVDQEACVGSRACMAACPYEARYFNWREPAPVKRMPFPPTPEMPVPQQKGTVGKCVLCADRLPHGELPACVDECPMGVLYIGDLVTDVAVNGLGTTVVLSEFLHANDAVRLKEELGTNPRVYYILGHGQNLGQLESES
jgi:molybdopterin-containing oxidoreductase family iron-sulfur binding subunit